jgi:hypothetical protein
VEYAVRGWVVQPVRKASEDRTVRIDTIFISRLPLFLWLRSNLAGETAMGFCAEQSPRKRGAL